MTLNKGNCSTINLQIVNKSNHDIILKDRPLLGSLHQIRSVTSVDLKFREFDRSEEHHDNNHFKESSESLSHDKTDCEVKDSVEPSISPEIVKCGFWHKLPLLPLLWHANAIDEN